MNVTSIYPNVQIGLPSAIGGTTAPTLPVDADGDRSGGASATVSPLAQLLGSLQQLQQTNPGQLKTVLTDIAGKLQAAAQQDGGRDGQFLNDLAGRFQQAAQTGDLSSIQPRHHHGHHHHHGATGYQQADPATSPSQPAGGGQNAAGATDVRSQVLDIINSVLAQDVGTVTG
jgi:hypothetical protein